VEGGEALGGLAGTIVGELRRRSGLAGFATAPALFHPLDVARWRRRVGGVSVRTVFDVGQSAYVRNNVPVD